MESLALRCGGWHHAHRQPLGPPRLALIDKTPTGKKKSSTMTRPRHQLHKPSLAFQFRSQTQARMIKPTDITVGVLGACLPLPLSPSLGWQSNTHDICDQQLSRAPSASTSSSSRKPPSASSLHGPSLSSSLKRPPNSHNAPRSLSPVRPSALFQTPR